jgi:hypothetical protein
MEIVGLLASVAQLADLTLKVFTNLYRFYGDLKNAPVRSAELREELGTILSVIETLKEALDQNTRTNPNLGRGILETTVAQFVKLLQEMERRIAAHRTSVIQRLKWPFDERENKQFVERIERYKNTFNLALNVSQTYYSNTLHEPF